MTVQRKSLFEESMGSRDLLHPLGEGQVIRTRSSFLSRLHKYRDLLGWQYTAISTVLLIFAALQQRALSFIQDMKRLIYRLTKMIQ